MGKGGVWLLRTLLLFPPWSVDLTAMNGLANLRFTYADHNGDYDDGEAIVQDDGDGELAAGGLDGDGADEVLTSRGQDLTVLASNDLFSDTNHNGSYADSEAIVEDAGDRNSRWVTWTVRTRTPDTAGLSPQAANQCNVPRVAFLILGRRVTPRGRR